MITGIYIRGRRKDGSWGSFDIGDPELSDGDVAAWLIGNKVNDFGVRVIGVLLDRPILRKVGLSS
jgi:hypothetical protein